MSRVIAVMKNELFRVARDGEPQRYVRADGTKRVAESGETTVVATRDGTVTVLSNATDQAIETDLGPDITSLVIAREDPLEVLVGTEGAHLHRLCDGGVSKVESFDELACRGKWHTPWGGPPALRSLAVSPNGRAYADIHVGSIMRSTDRGLSWSPVTPTLHEDVHEVTTCPAAPARVYANTADGVYVSDDCGDSWHYRGRDLGGRYGRAVAVSPDDPDLLLATVSDGPHGDDVHGQLFRSEDAGHTWTHIQDGFPASTPQNIDTFHLRFDTRGTAWAAVGSALYAGRDHATRWERFWDAPEQILMLA
jgi:Sortilin, neurotensin receptor 3,